MNAAGAGTGSREAAWKRELLSSFRLYAVTDIKRPDSDVLEKIENALRGGVDIIQVRSKQLTDGSLYQLSLRVKELASRYRKLFFINDRADLALAVDADGLHIGQDDMPVEAVRQIFSRARADIFIGKSTHSIEQAFGTAAEDVDYIGLGPVFSTPTKADYVPVGPEIINEVCTGVKKPVVVIGGINEYNLGNVLKSGARRIAVVRAIFEAENTYEAAKSIRQQIDTYWN